jgi:hypothetical protein
MERFYHVDPALAALWHDTVRQPVSIRARNSAVAVLAAMRDCMRDPRRVMSLDTGEIDRLPWTFYAGGKVPLVGAIPQPYAWADGPHSESYEGRARIVSDAITECLRELARSGQLVDRPAAQTAPAGAAVSFERYVGVVAANEGDVQDAMISERASSDAQEPQLILEDPDVVRRVHDVLKFAVQEKLAILAALREPGVNVSTPRVQSMADSPTVLEMAQRAVNARRNGNRFAQLAFTTLGIAAALALDYRGPNTADRYTLFPAR